MFYLENLKEIVIKPNKDKTYNLLVEFTNEATVNYPRVIISSLKFDALTANDGEESLFTMEEVVK